MSRRLALITGGTSGIGAAVARALAVDHDLALAYAADHARAQATREALLEAVPDLRVELFAGPLDTPGDARALAERVTQTCAAAPAVLVPAAGRLRDGLFLGSDFEPFERVLHEHLVVPMALAHRVLPAMYRARYGRVVLVSSIAARFAKRGQTGYAAAKAGLEGFARTLALEVAHRGVTVNAVAPGLIDTPMTAPLLARLERDGGAAARIPAAYVGRPEDVAGLVSYLCSDAARYVTGAVLVVDGGRSLGDARS